MPEGQQITEEDIKKMSPEEISELQKQQCIFCHINEGKIPAKKVYEDAVCFVILDINPATKGHMLLIPKDHFVVMPQAPDEIVRHLGRVAKLLSRAAIRAVGAEGTNIFVANGAIAGQRAPHIIVHIIPRVEQDHIKVFEFPEKSIPSDELKRIQTSLAQRLGTNLSAIKPETIEAEIKKESISEPIEPEKVPGPEEIKETLAKPKKPKKKKETKPKKKKLEEVGLDDLTRMLEE